jgi:hypothetical protein
LNRRRRLKGTRRGASTLGFGFALAVTLSACDLDLDTGEAGAPIDVEGRLGPNLVAESMDDGSVRLVVDATSDSDVVYVDLERGEQLSAADADSDTWTLGFRRFFIITNGGFSGPGDAEVVWVEADVWDPAESIPSEGWRIDEADSDDEDSEPDLAFIDWYDYDINTHTLTPKPRTYFVRKAGRVHQLRVEGYYSEAGTPANVTLRWLEVTP